MNYTYLDKKYRLLRYPTSDNRSLRAWSAADEYLLEYITKRNIEHLLIYNDRFGALTCCAEAEQKTNMLTNYSHMLAASRNMQSNRIDMQHIQFLPLEEEHQLEAASLALLKTPKSIDLFEYYLAHAHQNIEEGAEVVAAFMTRYFSKAYIEVAERYFEEVEQSRAKKKARLLIMRKKKTVAYTDLIHELEYEEQIYQQYYGVFSAQRIDYATQFFLEHLSVKEEEENILDLASGNGVIARKARALHPTATIHLLDDSYLAIASSRLNMPKDACTVYHCCDTLQAFEPATLDLVLSNPPFHFEHEVNIQVALGLFASVANCLKETGRFRLVANKHLGYETHLFKYFQRVERVVENDKFVILEARNPL